MNSDAKKETWLIRAPRLVTPDAVLDNTDIIVADGKIHSISQPSTSVTTDVSEVIHLDGTTWYPGFIDIHIHGSVGVDLLTASAEDLGRVSQFLARNGVTAWMPSVVPAPLHQYESAAQAVEDVIKEQSKASNGENKPLSTGARVLGMHYEGPFVNDQQCGCLHTEYFRRFTEAAQIDSLPLPASARARLITLAPEVEGGVELVRELTRRNWTISIGHTRSDLETLDRAYEAGARHMTHFMNAMAPLHHRSPGPIAWGLSRDDVSCDLIADGIHVDRFMLRLLVKLKKSDRLVLISDAVSATGMGDGKYQIWGDDITVQDGRTSNGRGTIAGSVITMLDAVRMMLSLDIPEIEVARMAATNPARLLGLKDECGSIEEGKRADIVALDQDGNVMLAMVGGAIAYSREKFRAA